MNKPFLNFLVKPKDNNLSFKNKKENKANYMNKPNERSPSLIIFGVIVSLGSICLLLLTIKNKFG